MINSIHCVFQVNEDDFSMFKNVIHIDAGDNHLQLRKFSIDIAIVVITGCCRLFSGAYVYWQNISKAHAEI
jgi:hypothetical protein